ncbi:CGNR zinc finger domain-containing protein [Amycolatopsis carbonis]|uniref:CGNR zinc finger domain-containing protein n=1 Tax=Amycolatopsis carbonis TaxID=715471 RepID=A0A9Y2IMY2_9PSEU|nr:CGNR zinc finger domain-containing protein [Amycolatopsis sp. 2-15]WIX82772.1 CGNR zinc finger domain-containing protein [Amycolatopsis sp. 2-15]
MAAPEDLSRLGVPDRVPRPPRNNSRVWHDVKVCGNIANLRASRARRRRVVL